MKKVLLEWTTQEELTTLIKHLLDESLERYFHKPEKPAVSGYYTRKEVAKLLRISLPTLHEYSKHDILIGYRIGGRVLYKISEVEQAVAGINTLKYKRGL